MPSAVCQVGLDTDWDLRGKVRVPSACRQAVPLVWNGERVLSSRDRLLRLLAEIEGLGPTDTKPWEGATFVQNVLGFEMRTPWGSHSYCLFKQDKTSSGTHVPRLSEIMAVNMTVSFGAETNDRALLRCAEKRGIGELVEVP